MTNCKHYDKKTESCEGYRAVDQPGGWIEKFPGECVFKGTPPEEDKHNKWCLGYEPGKEGEVRGEENV
ncbi:hypothetical protein ES703_60585 [subsurface metagenome]